MNAFFAVCLLSLTTLSAVPETLVWQENYGQALQSARSHQRPLLLVMQDPSDPNDRLQPIDSVSDKDHHELLSRFELCRVDVTTPHGEKTARAFGAEQFPYTVMIGNQGKKIVFRQAGAMASEDWKNTLASYQSPPEPALSRTTARASFGSRTNTGRRLRSRLRAPRPCKT